MMEAVEHALRFECRGAALYGILSLPERASSRGVVIVVGGPQYRIGSHRQFVLLARQLAQAGLPVLRFDYRGMGDSEGDARSFAQVDDDIRAAVDTLEHAAPMVREVVVLGLCDAACAALFYAHRDPRISGLVLLNPWGRTDEGLARARLKHYYLGRLFERELWQKISTGRFEYRKAWRSLASTLATVLGGRVKGSHDAREDDAASLPARMLDGLRRFNGNVLFVLSGNDLTANEFLDLCSSSPDWQKAMTSPRITHHTLSDANHTFSRRDWRENIACRITEWIDAY